MRYTLLIALREYAENVKTKGFWIGVLLFPIMLWVGIKVPRFLEEKAKPSRHFVLVDQTGRLEEPVLKEIDRDHAKRTMVAIGAYANRHGTGQSVTSEALEQMPGDVESMIKQWMDANDEQLDGFLAKGLDVALAEIKKYVHPDAPEFEEPRRLFLRAALPDGIDPEADREALTAALRPYLVGDKQLAGDNSLFAFIFLPSDTFETVRRPGTPPISSNEVRGVEYWSSNLTDTELKKLVSRAVNREVRRELYDAKEIDPTAVREVQRSSVFMTALNPKKAAGKEAVSLADTIRQWAPIGFVYLLFVGIMTVVQMLLNNTVEEKSNRIIEVLLSSVTPGELMRGKLFGIAGVGFTMLGMWILSLLLVLKFMSGPEVEWPKVVLELLQTSGLLVYFVIYFVFGYLFYAGIFLALGSVCNTIKDAQNYMGPVVMVMIVPLITMFFIPKDPNGTLATVLSWIPIYTPFVMMNRAAADPPLVDLVGTGVLLVLSTAAMLWLTGKIFRTAILRTGQPPRFKELIGWIRS